MKRFKCMGSSAPPSSLLPFWVQTRTRRMNASRHKLKRNKSTRFNYIHYKWNWLMSDSSEWCGARRQMASATTTTTTTERKIFFGKHLLNFPDTSAAIRDVKKKQRPQQTLVEQSSSWKGQSADSAVWNIYPKSSSSLLEIFIVQSNQEEKS